MQKETPYDDTPLWADNSLGWPALAAMLTPSVGCECQMLALAIADQLEAARSRRTIEQEPARH